MAEQASRIAALASLIHNNTHEIDKYLKANGRPSPSLDVNANPDFFLPGPLAGAQMQVLEACTELQALLEGPRAHFTHITSPRVRLPTHVSLQEIC
jgi:hypothetical protein